MLFIGTPHTKGAGYFCNDNTASGGIKQEGDVRTCTHCQAVIIMQDWKSLDAAGKLGGGFCMRCNAPVCGACNHRMMTHGCEPFIKKIDKELDATVKLDQFRKLAGLDTPEPPRAFFIPGSSRS
jgi:hypothetical protein